MSILERSDGNYTGFIEKIKSVVLIDFYSPTCGPCQTLLIYLPKLWERYQDETVVIGKYKMVKRAEVDLLGIDAYIKIIDKALGKGRILSRLFR